MNMLMNVFSTFAAQSWRIGCLICVLGALRWVMRGRISQQIFFVSWIIVALTLLVPVTIPVAWSPIAFADKRPTSVLDGTNALGRFATHGLLDLFSTLDLAAARSIQPESKQFLSFSRSSLMVTAWLIGVAVLSVIRAATWRRFRLRLRQSVAPANSIYEALVAECAETLGIKTRISLFVTDVAAGPAIGGLWRPYLLIPSSLGESLSVEELRLVIFHELGHWRRRDTVANFLVQCALILHWFNPAAWVFASLARSDCELACDEFVLGRMATAGPFAYGETILKVLATVRQRNAAPALLGILGRKQQLKRRFEMIARFRTVSFARIIAGWSLIGVVVIVAATGKLKASSAGSDEPGRIAAKPEINATDMKHYENSQWKFSIDVPKNWDIFPAVPTNSPYEIVRFASVENNKHNLLIVFRNPRDPKQTLPEWLATMQQMLAQGGFGNFATGKTTIGSRDVVTLDFDKAIPNVGTWSCRHYMIADDTLGYVLGFGTAKDRTEMTDLYDRMAKSFQILK